jgi:hypothetical protein
MDMLPSILPDKLPLEVVAVYLQLATRIGTDTIAGTPEFVSDPIGLVFTEAATIDAGKTAAALVGGGEVGVTYTLSALCSLSSGQVVQPVVGLPVIAPVTEVLQRRPITL